MLKVTVPPLVLKEARQMLRNKQFLKMLIIAPMIQICGYGIALNPEVHYLPLGIIDFAQTNASRELTAALIVSKLFVLRDSGGSVQSLYNRVEDGSLEAAIIIPPEFQRYIAAGRTCDVPVVISAVDANSAGLASAYVKQIFANFNQKLLSVSDRVQPQISIAYNPGLNAVWFFTPGIISVSLTVIGSLASAATLLREKESGTIDQLMMTPSSSADVLIAKLVPLLTVLFLAVNVSALLACALFSVPERGNYLIFCVASIEYTCFLLAMGLALATVFSNYRQAMLSTFFFMAPIIQLSGAITPVETMPPFVRTLSLLDPARYYVSCLRGLFLKGNGLPELWINLVVLAGFAILFMTMSISRFRRQLQ